MIEIFDMDQGSEAWMTARLGLPTASEFATVLAKGRDGGDSKTRKTYLYKLVGEIITNTPAENYTNAHMERGTAMESEARAAYAFMKDAEPQQVGFIKRGRAGASPDSLIDANGLLEIKTRLPHLMVEVILRGDLPPEHKAQCQGQLWVSEREWLDFCAYWPGMPLFVHRVYRDTPYINDLAGAVDAFNEELDRIVERIRRYGEAA